MLECSTGTSVVLGGWQGILNACGFACWMGALCGCGFENWWVVLFGGGGVSLWSSIGR